MTETFIAIGPGALDVTETARGARFAINVSGIGQRCELDTPTLVAVRDTLTDMVDRQRAGLRLALTLATDDLEQLRSTPHFYRPVPEVEGECECGLESIDPLHLRSNGRNEGRQPWVSREELDRINDRRDDYGMPYVTRAGVEVKA